MYILEMDYNLLCDCSNTAARCIELFVKHHSLLMSVYPKVSRLSQ